MRLSELSDEYTHRAEILSQRVRELKKVASALPESQRLAMQRRILSLAEDVTMCRKYAAQLKTYRNGDELR